MVNSQLLILTGRNRIQNRNKFIRMIEAKAHTVIMPLLTLHIAKNFLSLMNLVYTQQRIPVLIPVYGLDGWHYLSA